MLNIESYYATNSKPLPWNETKGFQDLDSIDEEIERFILDTTVSFNEARLSRFLFKRPAHIY